MTEEKRTWAYGVVAAVVPIVYFSLVLSQLPRSDVSDIEYMWPLLSAIGAGFVLNALAAPPAKRTDDRDKQVNRFGGHVAFMVMSGLTVIPLALAVARVDAFWIANTLYLAYVLSAIAFSAVKITAYRRGI